MLVCVYHGGSRRIYFKFPIFVCHVPSAFFLNFASRKKFNFIRANEKQRMQPARKPEEAKDTANFKAFSQIK